MDLDQALSRLGRDARWSLRIDRVGDFPECIYEHNAHELLRTASVGKLFLLIEVADLITRGDLDPSEPLDRETTEPVADSGLWQHLSTTRLPVVDLARLVGTVSDNWATNVLIGRVRLAAVQARAASLTADGSTLHDRVRDIRTAEHPRTPSEGSAADLARLFADLHAGTVVSEAVSALVLDWLSTSVDLSMIASPLGLDPLAHAEADRGCRVWNKTGTDSQIRAEAGLMEVPSGTYAYAAICNWTTDRSDPGSRDVVLDTMRRIGEFIRDAGDSADGR